MSYGLLVFMKLILGTVVSICTGVIMNYENKVDSRGENRWRKLGQSDFYALFKKGDPDCHVIIYSQIIGGACAVVLFILFGLVYVV